MATGACFSRGIPDLEQDATVTRTPHAGLGLVLVELGLLTLALLARADDAPTDDTDLLTRQLESVPAADLSVYGLKDSLGQRMDCLEVFQAPGAAAAGIYHGVYHTQQAGVFVTHLARSTDLRSWSHLTTLDTHASQPTVNPCTDGSFLVAYEHDEPNSVWIRLRWYRNLTDLEAGRQDRQHDILRTLAPTAEGTPSIESVTGLEHGIDSAEIRLRFHYYKDGQVDQLATGVLTDFRSWKASPADTINARLIADGWLGNLGDRTRFTWRDKTFYLQEIQRRKGDWSSWRVCLCDASGMPIRPLAIATHGRAAAFSNPSATWVLDAHLRRRLVVTCFLPTEGNPPAEAGTLLFVVTPSDP